jgi:small neutral amino acid transporter SnatA (MarC family)
MRVFVYAVIVSFVAALYVYFFGTTWVASLTGFSPRTVSLTAGTAIAILGFSVMMLGKLAAKRDLDKR